MHIEAKNQERVSLTAFMTNECVISTDASSFALKRFISDQVIFSRTQTESQSQVTTFFEPLKGFHDLPHDINLSLLNESILKNVESRSLICEDGKHNFDDEFCIKPVVNLSESNTKMSTLSNAEILSITSNVTLGELC